VDSPTDALRLGRRTLLTLGAAAAAAPALAAGETDVPDPTEVVRLWPGPPPGAPASLPREQITNRIATSGLQDRYVTGVAQPILTVFRPARPNGAAMLVIPGGGYIRVVIDKEGFEAGHRLAAAGVTAFVLRYRLPADGWAQRHDAALQDVQRAMRLIRANAAAYGVDPARVGVIGFSAGGHLTASLSTRWDAPLYAPIDAADRLAARPDIAALGYPVMTMSAPLFHKGSADALLGADAAPELRDAYSPERHVRPDTPPSFMFHAADDPAVPLENSLNYMRALRAQKVAVELHVFEEGGHGFGIARARGKPAAAWPDLFLTWAQRHRFLPA